MILDTDTIDTDAGTYTVRFILDEAPEQPYDEGFGLIMSGSRHRVGIDEGTLPFDVKSLVVDAFGDRWARWDHDRRSGEAIVRYMRLKGIPGATLVNDDYTGEKMPVADRNVEYAGVAWAPDDAANPDEYVGHSLDAWRAWAHGDVFGYDVIGPDSEPLDDASCWGFYGLDRERDYVLSMARADVERDVEERSRAAGLVGSGFVGLV